MVKQDLDRLESQYYEKDEIGKRLEDENNSLSENIKILQYKLEEFGDQSSTMLTSERMNQS